MAGPHTPAFQLLGPLLDWIFSESYFSLDAAQRVWEGAWVSLGARDWCVWKYRTVIGSFYPDPCPPETNQSQVGVLPFNPLPEKIFLHFCHFV